MNSNTTHVCCMWQLLQVSICFFSLLKTLKGKNFNSEKFFVNMLANFLMLLKLVAAKVAFFSRLATRQKFPLHLMIPFKRRKQAIITFLSFRNLAR